VAPEIYASNPSAGEVLVLDRPTVAFVFVADEDDSLDSLEYLWWIEGAGTILSHDILPNSAGSSVTLAVDSALHDQTLRVRVADETNDSVELSWPVQVVQEGL